MKELPVVVVSCLPFSPQAVSRGAFWKDLFHCYQVGTEDRQRRYQESWVMDYMFPDIMLIVHSPWAAVLSRCLGNTLLGGRVAFLHSAHLLSHWPHPKLFPKALLQSQTSNWRVDAPVLLIRSSVYNKARLFPEFPFLHLLYFLLISITFFSVLEKNPTKATHGSTSSGGLQGHSR